MLMQCFMCRKSRTSDNSISSCRDGLIMQVSLGVGYWWWRIFWHTQVWIYNISKWSVYVRSQIVVKMEIFKSSDVLEPSTVDTAHARTCGEGQHNFYTHAKAYDRLLKYVHDWEHVCFVRAEHFQASFWQNSLNGRIVRRCKPFSYDLYSNMEI